MGNSSWIRQLMATILITHRFSNQPAVGRCRRFEHRIKALPSIGASNCRIWVHLRAAEANVKSGSYLYGQPPDSSPREGKSARRIGKRYTCVVQASRYSRDDGNSSHSIRTCDPSLRWQLPSPDRTMKYYFHKPCHRRLRSPAATIRNVPGNFLLRNESFGLDFSYVIHILA